MVLNRCSGTLRGFSSASAAAAGPLVVETSGTFRFLVSLVAGGRLGTLDVSTGGESSVGRGRVGFFGVRPLVTGVLLASDGTLGGDPEVESLDRGTGFEAIDSFRTGGLGRTPRSCVSGAGLEDDGSAVGRRKLEVEADPPDGLLAGGAVRLVTSGRGGAGRVACGFTTGIPELQSSL